MEVSPALRGRDEGEERISSLALRYRSGDRAVLGELYAELEPLIDSFLRRYLSRPRSLPVGVEPEDLCQQAYVALAEAALGWQPDRLDNFVPYFFRSFPWRIARHLWPQALSRRTTRLQVSSMPHDSLMDWVEAVPGPDGRDWDGALACSELLGGLPRLYGDVVRLHLYHGLSFAEAGEAMGIGRSAAHEAYRRALSLLRSLMAEPAASRDTGGKSRPATNGGNGVSADTLRRCVDVMHRLAPNGSPLPGRAILCREASLTSQEYRRIMARLKASGCLVGRRPGSAGSLACPSAAETMEKATGNRHQ